MKILDVSAGNRAMWFDKQHPDCTYIDLRMIVRPDCTADSRYLPFKNAVFDLAVFDPPHVNFGKNAEMSKTYGWHTTEEIRDIIRRTGIELSRVLRPQAIMNLKWNDHDQKLDTVLKLLSTWEPLFGQRTGGSTSKHPSSTYWIVCRNLGHSI